MVIRICMDFLNLRVLGNYTASAWNTTDYVQGAQWEESDHCMPDLNKRIFS